MPACCCITPSIRADIVFLGASETADNPPDLFRAVDRSARIYQSIGGKVDLVIAPRPIAAERSIDGFHAPARGPRPISAVDEARLHRELLEKLAPPSILVDDSQRAAHLSEGAGRFLQPSGGMLTARRDRPGPSRAPARSPLVPPSRLRARPADDALPVDVQFNGTPHRVIVHVQPAAGDPLSGPRHALVLFLDGGAGAASGSDRVG